MILQREIGQDDGRQVRSEFFRHHRTADGHHDHSEIMTRVSARQFFQDNAANIEPMIRRRKVRRQILLTAVYYRSKKGFPRLFDLSDIARAELDDSTF